MELIQTINTFLEQIIQIIVWLFGLAILFLTSKLGTGTLVKLLVKCTFVIIPVTIEICQYYLEKIFKKAKE